jgi:hypothetical protein
MGEKKSHRPANGSHSSKESKAMTTPELTLYILSLLCLCAGIAILVRARRGKRNKRKVRLGIWHKDSDTLKRWAWGDAKARENQNRNY